MQPVDEMLDRRRVGIRDREHERALGRRRQADELGTFVTLADLGVKRRDACAGGQRCGEQRERGAGLLLTARADDAVGRAGSHDRGVRRELAQRLGQVVSRLAVLPGAEQRDEVGRALEHRAALGPRPLERRGRVGALREGGAGAHPAFIDGLCAPFATITMRPPAISTSRLRPAWNVRLRRIVTQPWRTSAEPSRRRGADEPGVPRQAVTRPRPLLT